MPSRPRSVYLYVPNLIGYARILLAAASFAVASERPVACVTLYFVSFAADELDGRFARLLDQCSTFGAVLDMVTDRVATACLLVVAADAAGGGAGARGAGLALMALDLFSHWYHMYASLAEGAASHKDVGASSPWLLRAYYSRRLFMGFCCVSAEVAYLAAYAAWHPHTPPAARAWAAGAGLACAPGWALKQLLNVMQLLAAADTIVRADQRRAASGRRGRRA